MSSDLPDPPEKPRRIVYLGTPAMAVQPLETLHSAGFDIALVVTGADKRRGRRSEPTPTPVKRAALDLGLSVTHDLQEALNVRAELGVVVACGQIIRRPVLERLPMINLHFSLLPRWRGAAPVERALLAGDDRTGVCVMAVDEALDTGDVYAARETPIGERMTAAELRSELTTLGADLLVDTLREGLSEPRPQTGEVTYAMKIGPADLALDWNLPAVDLDRVVRVGGAWTTFRGRRLKVHDSVPVDVPGPGETGTIHGTDVTCREGTLRLVVVQPEGKARIDASAWLNGARPEPDEKLRTPASPTDPDGAP